MQTNNPKLDIGFWHPLGLNANETPEEIIHRKKYEIEKKGWTLWFFRNRSKKFYDLWYEHIAKNNQNNVIVICPIAKTEKPKDDHKVDVNYKTYKYYRPIGEDSIMPIPNDINVRHTSNNKRGTAFIVKKIIFPTDPVEATNVIWLRENGQWSSDRIPTRGEYLIKLGDGQLIRNYSAILELKYPYFAEVKH